MTELSALWPIVAVNVALVAWLVVCLVVPVVRFVRATPELRRSMWQAWMIRWRWRRQSRMLGLVAVDRMPKGLAALTNRDQNVPGRILVPNIRLKVDEYGVVAWVSTLPKVGRDEWVKAAPDVANAWGAVRVAVTQSRPGLLVVRAVRRDPLIERYREVLSGGPPASLEWWEIGRDEYGELVKVRLGDVPGLIVAGMPGYGKTSLINSFIGRFAPSGAVQLAVVDGKGGAEYEDLADRFFVVAGDDLQEANGVFRRVYELRRRRAECVRSMLGVKNMWHVGPSERWPLVVLVIDEAHTFLSERKDDKVLGPIVAENRRLVEDVIKKGRSVGICVILATQKSTGDAIPTAVRDVCPVALSFGQRTNEAAVAVLGADIRDYPDTSPVALQDPAYVGVASMVVQGRPGFTRVRTPYVAEKDVALICREMAALTRDPVELLPESAGLRFPSAGDLGGVTSGAQDRSDGTSGGVIVQGEGDAA